MNNREAIRLYVERFGDDALGEIAVPEVFDDERAPEVLMEAIRAGVPLTPETLEEKLGSISWNW